MLAPHPLVGGIDWTIFEYISFVFSIHSIIIIVSMTKF